MRYLSAGTVIVLSALLGPACGQDRGDDLAAFLGPKAGKTYVYSIDPPGPFDLKQTSVAAVPDGDVALATCSPASAEEYPDELRKLGAQPVVSRIEVRGNKIVHVGDSGEMILIQGPLRPGSGTWTRQIAASHISGHNEASDTTCGIESVGVQLVLGRSHRVVTVVCRSTGRSPSIVTEVAYAAGIGPVVESTKVEGPDGKILSSTTRQLVTIRDGTGACSAMVDSLRK